LKCTRNQVHSAWIFTCKSGCEDKTEV
jgi:hypothetical protein